MEKENKKVYFVLEYKEKLTNKKKSIVVRGASKEAIDAQTENFETIERLAALYFDWTNALVENPKKNLIDMYIIDQESVLGNLLSSYDIINGSIAVSDISFYDKEVKDEKGNITTMNMYEYGKALTEKMPIKLMQDRTEIVNKSINYGIDRTPIIQMPIRTRRI